MFKKKKVKEICKNMFFAIRLSFNASKSLFIIKIVLIVLSSIVPYLTIYLWRLVLNHLTSFELLPKIIVNILIIYCLSLFLEKSIGQFSKYINYRYNDEINFYLDNRLVDKISNIDLSFYDSSILNNKMTNSKRMLKSVQSSVWLSFSIITSIIKVIVAGILLFELNHLLAIVVLILSIPCLIFKRKMKKIEDDYQRDSVVEYRKMAYYKRLFFNKTMYEIKIYDLKDFLQGKYLNEWEKWFEEKNKIRKKNILITVLSNIVSSFSDVLLFIFGLKKLVNKSIGVGDIQYYLSLINKLRNEIDGLIETIVFFWSAVDQLSIVSDFLNLESSFKTIGTKKIYSFNTIEFKNVNFCYPYTDKYVLKNCSFVVNKGENIGLVGLNGSGKSTIVKLLLRFYDPTDGEILIDGVNYLEFDINSIRNLFSALFQDFARYGFSLRENVALSNINNINDDSKINFAIKVSKVSDFINDWELGIETSLTRLFDKNGKELSVGQWQRIALARAFFKDADIILLDEPSSSLDPEAVHMIFLNFKTLMQGKTSVFTSHRLSNITMASRIIVLDNGKIIENGSHYELINRDGLYKKLFELQAKKYIN